MQNNFAGKHFLTLEDYTPEDLRYLLDLALRLKKEKKDHVDQRKCIGDNMLMLFEMESTRTRCAFETSAQDLGMGTTYLSNSHFGTKETIKDSMRVFSSMYDVIAYRGKDHKQLLEMAKESTIPIINGYTMHEHPTQMLADFMTLDEVYGRGIQRQNLRLYRKRRRVLRIFLRRCVRNAWYELQVHNFLYVAGGSRFKTYSRGAENLL